MAVEDEFPSPAVISLVGAIAVVLFYWLHLWAVGDGFAWDEDGVEITLFIAAFLAQYIPLAGIKSRIEDYNL